MFKTHRLLPRATASKPKLILLSLFVISALQAENIDDLMDGFDDEPKTETKVEIKKDKLDEVLDGFDDEPIVKKAPRLHPSPPEPEKRETFASSIEGITGKLTEQTTFSYNDTAPHENFSSLKTSLLLDYEHKFDNGFKIKTNAKAYYDAIYSIRGREKYSKDELDELESEVELFDAYVEGALSDNLDMKLGRQVVVWGRSDTIRVTDVLNPLDNRRPGMVDIEDLRLPVGMAKFDYFVGDWRVTPMAILEQRFSKKPPAGSAFNASSNSLPKHEKYNEVLPALSIGAEFSGFDVNFYAAQIRDDAGYFANGKLQHDKVTMLGTAVNLLSGSWLFKSELAHFDNKSNRTKGLLGAEYNGIADTLISYDVAIEKQADQTEQYQHAFRMSSDFMNARLKGNYLISLFGKGFDEGGFQRAWLKYDIVDGVYANVGVVDYIGGSSRFNAISDNDMAFLDVSYSF